MGKLRRMHGPFYDYFFGMAVPDRDALAARAGTTRGVLTQVAYGHKQIELGFADALVAVCAGKVVLDWLPLTDNAKRQRSIRESALVGQVA